MKKNVNFLIFLEFSLVFLMLLGIIPLTCSYLVLFVLLLGIFVLSDLEFLGMYIISIPFFVVMPPNFFSDAMSVWRIVLFVWIMKIFFMRFDVGRTLLLKDTKINQKKDIILSEASNFFREIKKQNYFSLLLSVLLFGLICFFSLLFSQDVVVGIKKIIFIFSIFSLFSVVMYSVRSVKDLKFVVKSILIASVEIILVGYFQLFLTFILTLSDFWGVWYSYVISVFYGERMMILLSYSNTWFSYYGDEISPTLRMFSVMPDSHSFSMLMILFSSIALFYYGNERAKYEKIKYVFLLAFFFLAIFLSGSRGAWAGWLGAFIASLFLYFGRKKIPSFSFLKIKEKIIHKKHYRNVVLSLIFFVLLFPISAFVLQKNQEVQMIKEGRAITGSRIALLQRTRSIYDFSETSNKGRIEIWKDSLESVAKNPIIGVGFGNFPTVLGEKTDTSKMGSSAHNIYLDIAVETGILGLAAFLSMIFIISKNIFQISHRVKKYSWRLFLVSFLTCFVWIMSYGFFDVVMINDKVLMFLVLIIAIFYKLDALKQQN